MKSSIGEPPPVITNRARVVIYAVLGKSIKYSGRKLIFVGGKELKKVPCVAIGLDGSTKGKEAFWLSYCDKDWNSIASFPYESAEIAMKRAERMYPGISDLWQTPKISKRKAENYIKKMNDELRCSFCGVSHYERQSVASSGMVHICDVCIDGFYKIMHKKG
jgi:ClpX C4-type zinc finger